MMMMSATIRMWKNRLLALKPGRSGTTSPKIRTSSMDLERPRFIRRMFLGLAVIYGIIHLVFNLLNVDTGYTKFRVERAFSDGPASYELTANAIKYSENPTCFKDQVAQYVRAGLVVTVRNLYLSEVACVGAARRANARENQQDFKELVK